MYKRMICAMVIAHGAFGLAYGTTMEPHPKPIVTVIPPKPNIMLIVGTNGNMNKYDMPFPDNYQPVIKGDLNYVLKYGFVKRYAVLQWVLLDLFENYRYQANIGIAPFDSLLGQYFDRDFSPVTNLESDQSLNDIKDRLMSYSFVGSTLIAPSIYRTSVIMRGKNPTFERPIQYCCQEQYIVILTDVERPIYRYQTDILMEDKGLEPTVNSLGEQLSKVDVIRQSINKQPNDRENFTDNPWLGQGYKTMPFNLHAIRFSRGWHNDDAGLKRLISHPGKRQFIPADDSNDLKEDINRIFRDIVDPKSGTGSVEDQQSNKGRSTETIRYSSSYNASIWSSVIEAKSYGVTDKGINFDEILWTTSDIIKPEQGKYLSFQHGKSVDLNNVRGLTASQKSWLKGNNVKSYRQHGMPVGDIIDSHLIYSAKDRLNINLNLLNTEVRKEFFDYLIQKNRHAKHYNYLIAGSNDGLINFIYGEKASNGKGGERHTSYFPSFFIEDIDEITEHNYQHSYKVNGISTLFDAKVGREFKTIGITSMGAGKEGLVGYELFSSTGSADIKPNFEIRRNNVFSSLGYTYSEVEYFNHLNTRGEPEAVAVFGNGYTLHRPDNDQPSSIYLINAVTGEKIEEIILPSGNGGASSPAIVVSESDRGYQQLDRIYVGDQSGKLFRIVFNSHRGSLKDYSVTTMFDAGQPITVRPTLMREPQSDKIWVYFGTGRAILLVDNSAESLVTHNFYGLKDNDVLISQYQLDRQEMIGRHTDSDGYGAESFLDLLEVSNNVEEQSKYGWYLPLKMHGEREDTGERVIFSASILGDQTIVFNTYGIQQNEAIKNDSYADGGTFGKIIFLDLFSGNGSRNVKGQSGIVSDVTSFGVPTGPIIRSSNLLSGNNASDNDYTSVVKTLRGDNLTSSHSTDESKDERCDAIATDMNGHQVGIPVDCPVNLKIESRRIFLKLML